MSCRLVEVPDLPEEYIVGIFRTEGSKLLASCSFPAYREDGGGTFP
jgi:hypothetical protein